MGEEIEKYILKRLDDAIEESKDSTDFNIAARFLLPKLHKDFSELKDLIEKKRNKITLATAPAPRPTPAVSDPTPPAHRDSAIPASTSAAASAKKDSKVTGGAPLGTIGDKKDTDTSAPTDVGDKKDTRAPPLDAIGDKKELDAPPDTGDKKDTDTGAQKDIDTGDVDAIGDKKELDAPPDTGDKKDTDALLDAIGDKKDLDAPPDTGDKKDTDAPLDAIDDDKESSDDEKESGAPSDAGAEKESGAPSDDIAGDKKESTAPLDASDEKEKGAPLADSAEKGSEISPATDAVTGDKSITPPASAGGGQKESNVSDESEISPVTDGGATDHKSKTPTSAATEEASLREQLYYLNNVLTEWQMITKKPFSYSDSISSIKDLSKTLKKIKQDLKPESIKKTEESSDSHTPQTGSSDNASQIETTPEVMEFRWSTPVKPKNVHGFEDRILSLERLLVLRRKDTDAFKAFGIHGMAGVGKTTLCQSIFKRPKVMEYFFPRIWVCLSKQKGEDEDNKKEVVKRMLRCLGIDDNIIKKVDEKQGIRGLLFALRLQLTGKRYFIVLDDAHNADKWFKMPDSDAENDNDKIYGKFSYGLPKECGGTVLVTSRVEQVVKNMVGEEENLRCIEPLTDQDTCWNIFKDTVEKDGIRFPDDLVKLKLEIVKRCDGLPLAAKLLGQIKHEELCKNRTAAGNQQAAIQAGNQQAAVQASNQQAAVQAAK